MSSKDIEKLKDLEATLEANSRAQKPKAILSASSLESKNPWSAYLVVQKLHPDALLLSKPNDQDAGYDLHAFEDTLIPARGDSIVKTYIAVGLPPGVYGRVAPRSGLAVNHHIGVGAGVIDRGYTGEIKVLLLNHSDVSYQVKRGDKIAQLILEKYMHCPIKEVRNIQEIMGQSLRGAAGIGSSGR